jgi:hypothetical protein
MINNEWKYNVDPCGLDSQVLVVKPGTCARITPISPRIVPWIYSINSLSYIKGTARSEKEAKEICECYAAADADGSMWAGNMDRMTNVRT